MILVVLQNYYLKNYFDEIIYLQLILPIIDGHCFVNKYKIIGFVSIIVDIVVL